MSDKAQAAAIYSHYFIRYGHEMQGCCPLIADEIQRAVGGEVVAGYLTFFGGSHRRSHWWVEKDGVVLDPMGDEAISHPDDYGGREEVHRDRAMLDRILPQYEQYRATPTVPVGEVTK
jgi:hypothetical protein